MSCVLSDNAKNPLTFKRILMRHRDKKIKFRAGRDANKMLVRKLVYNFIDRGKLETTLSKAKVVKALTERIISKARVDSVVHRQVVTRFFGDRRIVVRIFENIGKTVQNISGGYVRLIKLAPRMSDGAAMAKVEWAYPIVSEKKAAQPKKATEVKNQKSIKPAKKDA